jgi:hypothetical protein
MNLRTLKWLSRAGFFLLSVIFALILAEVIKAFFFDKPNKIYSLPEKYKEGNMPCDPVELTIKMLPMLCYAFFFENILIPVSKAFVLKDHNGSMGMKSSIISLSCSLIFYTFILAALSYIKYQNGDYLNS